MNFEIDIRKASSIVMELERERKSLESCYYEVLSVSRGNAFSGSSKQKIIRSLQEILKDIEDERGKLSQMEDCLHQVIHIYSMYEERIAKCENRIDINWEYGQTTGVEKISEIIPDIMDYRPPSKEERMEEIINNFRDYFTDEFGWKEVLSGAGYIGTIYNLITGIKDGKTWADLGKSGKETYDFISGAIKTYKNYKKIGNAVGTKTAMTWWAKNITGIKSLGRASAAKNPITRFKNNLTNKTSPFNAQIKNTLKDFNGGNGIGKAIASWGAVALTGVTNAFSNIDEQKESNGTMSTGRVVAETISETIIDTALTYGSGVVVGAAVTAALGTVAAPGVLVVAASGAIVAGVNAGVKALTGKTTTEWLSDTILDAGEAIGKKVGNAVRNVKQSIGNWFGKLAFG